MKPISYKRHRFRPEAIQLSVYSRFTLSLRDVVEMLAERGVDVSDEAIRVRANTPRPLCGQHPPASVSCRHCLAR